MRSRGTTTGEPLSSSSDFELPRARYSGLGVVCSSIVGSGSCCCSSCSFSSTSASSSAAAAARASTEAGRALLPLASELSIEAATLAISCAADELGSSATCGGGASCGSLERAASTCADCRFDLDEVPERRDRRLRPVELVCSSPGSMTLEPTSTHEKSSNDEPLGVVGGESPVDVSSNDIESKLSDDSESALRSEMESSGNATPAEGDRVGVRSGAAVAGPLLVAQGSSAPEKTTVLEVRESGGVMLLLREMAILERPGPSSGKRFSDTSERGDTRKPTAGKGVGAATLVAAAAGKGVGAATLVAAAAAAAALTAATAAAGVGVGSRAAASAVRRGVDSVERVGDVMEDSSKATLELRRSVGR